MINEKLFLAQPNDGLGNYFCGWRTIFTISSSRRDRYNSNNGSTIINAVAVARIIFNYCHDSAYYLDVHQKEIIKRLSNFESLFVCL